jgi:hypothetical protein
MLGLNKGRDDMVSNGQFCILIGRKLRFSVASLYVSEDTHSMNKMYGIRDAKLSPGRKYYINI